MTEKKNEYMIKYGANGQDMHGIGEGVAEI